MVKARQETALTQINLSLTGLKDSNGRCLRTEMIGKTLSHDKVSEKIGQGGMEEVYRAEDTNLSREVVIKVLPKFGNGILSITLILFLTAVGLAHGPWRSIGPEDRRASISALAIDPANPMTLYAGTSGDGVFQSTDRGANWSVINNGLTSLNVRSLAIDPTDPMTLYAGTVGGVFQSTDRGTN